MTTRMRHAGAPVELTLATALVWGHLKARQFDTALTLARGCLQVWPDDTALVLMAAYARCESGATMPGAADDPAQRAQDAALPAAAPWLRILRRRAASTPPATMALPGARP